MNKITEKSDDSQNRSPLGDIYVRVKTILKRLTKTLKKVYWSILGCLAVCFNIISLKVKGYAKTKAWKDHAKTKAWSDINFDLMTCLKTIKPYVLVAMLIVICMTERMSVTCSASEIQSQDLIPEVAESSVISATIIENVDAKDSTVNKTTTPIVLESEQETTPVTEEKMLKSNEEIANEIILGKWGSGEERRKALIAAGYDYDAIQAIVASKIPTPVYTSVSTQGTQSRSNILTKTGGICYNNPYGYKETWYSQKVLPGRGLNIPGRHVDSRGLVCDIDGYICVAISIYDTRFPYGSIIQTSLGLGKVYDHGCARGVIDVYCNW